MKRLLTSAVCLLLALATAARAAEPPTLPGKIDAVTVYRGQALVTRLVDLPATPGLQEIVVSELPAQIEPQSLYAEAGDAAEVRSVLYRERPVAEDVRVDVRKLDADLKALADQLLSNQQNLKVLGQERDYLTKLETFAAPTANVELSKGVLNAETLKNLTDYLFEKRQALSDKELKLTLDRRDLEEKLATAQRARQEVAANASRTVREAVIFVNQKVGGSRIKVRYLVDSASWDPSYNVRADKTGKVSVEYNASIQQLSGEDWTNVQITLSTATPALVAEAPALNPLKIALAASGDPNQKELTYDQLREVYRQKIREAEQARNTQKFDSNINGNNSNNANNNSNNNNSNSNSNNSNSIGGGGMAPPEVRAAADALLNNVAGEAQVAELLAGKSERTGRPRAETETIAVTYDLGGRLTLPSREDQQLIQIAVAGLKGTFYKLAQPLLTAYVYDAAELTNDSKMVLLAGPVSSYMEGQFVGHTQIPTVAVGEDFTVGFGIDAALRAARERIDKTEVTQGGNRQLTYTYRLQLENFSNQDVAVRLMDRLPVTEDKATDVNVSLQSAEGDLSKDADYQRTQRRKGLLRWDVTVPAQAIGDKAFGKEYKFNVEYDRMMTIVAGQAGPGESDASRRLSLQLNGPIQPAELTADNQALEKVLHYIQEQNGLNLSVNWPALAAAGVEKTTPVTVNLHHLPLRTVLATLLAEVPSTSPLDFANIDGVLRISTKVDLAANTPAKE